MNRNRLASLVLAVLAPAVSLVTLVVSCSRAEKPPERTESKPEPETRLERLVPSPIVLLHGMGGNGQAWNTLGEDFRNRGLRSGGIVRLGANGEVIFTAAAVPPQQADFFSLQISDPYQSLQAWTSELTQLLAAVHRRTHESRLVLVGHSAGGLTGRRYLVEHTGGHHLAKLVTLASPHRGSRLALIPLFLQDARDFVSANASEGSPISELANGSLDEVEHAFKIPLDAPILPGLLPERLNPDLTELNAGDHPLDVEYECLRALGGASFQQWNQMEQTVAEDLPLSWDRLQGSAKALLAFLRGDTNYQGDGAVTVASQDLRRVRFFQLHPDLIQECRGVEAGHSEIKEQVRDILSAINSPVRFLRARRTGDTAHTTLTVDFHDFFAGLAQVEALDIRGNEMSVSEPKIFVRRDETFGRVKIGPFDARHLQSVDIIVTSLDGRHHGRRILLAADAGNPERTAPERFELEVLRVEGIPLTPKPLLPIISWDADGSRADLQVRLFVSGEEVLRSRVHKDVGAAEELQEAAVLDAAIDLEEEWILLELWDMDDPGDDPDLIARRVLKPGQLPHGEPAVLTNGTPIVQLRVSGPTGKRIRWEPAPLLVNLER